MDQREIVARTEQHVRELLADDATGHDWWHSERVRRLALRIAAAEGADALVVELAALLHDIADWKFHDGDAALGPRLAQAWLTGLGVESAIVAHVGEIVSDLSFHGARVPRPMRTIEGRVVQDADRLDAIGAIGLARAFAYGGWQGQPIYAPDQVPTLHDSAEGYRTGSGSTVNHFHEKLLLLREMMNTESARRLAEPRHRVLEIFLAQFHAEWDGRR